VRLVRLTNLGSLGMKPSSSKASELDYDKLPGGLASHLQPGQLHDQPEVALADTAVLFLSQNVHDGP
jgi:hypothetical protein